MSLTSLRWGRREGDRPERRRDGFRRNRLKDRPSLESLEGRIAPAASVTSVASPAATLGTPIPATATIGTTTTLANSSTGSSVYGQSVAFTVTVAPTSGNGTPTGTVTLTTGSTTLGTATLSSNATATFNLTNLPVGSDAITAEYGGDSTFIASTSSTVTQTVSQAATSTAVSANPTTSNFGSAVELTATLSVTAPGGGTPTGTITFFNGTTSLGSSAVSNGTASISTSSLPVGASRLPLSTAAISNFTASTSPVTTVTVQSQTGTASKTSVTSTTTGSTVFGQPVSFTAVVAPATGSGTPTGTVTFYSATTSGSTPVGTATLTNGSATVALTTLPVGTDAVTASYIGDANFAGSTSSAVNHTVTQASTKTVVASSSSNSVAYGTSVTLTATISVLSPGAGTPTGSVTFYSGSTNLGTGTVSGGTATLATSSLPIGSNSITAEYTGDSNFASSTSAAITQTVTALATTTTLTSSSQTTLAGQSVTLTATVAASTTSGTTGDPTGTVQFLDGTTVIASETLNSTGVATLTTSTLSGGTHSITANYLGNTSFASSTSSAVVQTVTLQSTTVALSASPSGTSTSGQAVTLSATVAVVSPGTATPTGTVSFYAGTTLLGTSSLKNNAATLTTTAIPVGSNSLTAVYNGDALTGTSTSAVVTQVVGTATQIYINQIYLDLLDRPVDSTSLAKWTTKLTKGGESRAAFVQTIDHSLEVRTVAVQNVYLAYLSRLASQPEVNATLAAARAFGNDVRVPVLISAQYVNTVGNGTVDGYLSALTSSVIGAVNPAAFNEAYAAELISGAPKSKVVIQVLHSAPAASATIDALYNEYLNREPTVSELSSGLRLITSGGSPRVIQDGILSSKEYYDRVTSTTS